MVRRESISLLDIYIYIYSKYTYIYIYVCVYVYIYIYTHTYICAFSKGANHGNGAPLHAGGGRGEFWRPGSSGSGGMGS